MPKSPWVLFWKICASLSACAHYRRALELQPNYVRVHCNLGNSLKKLNRFDEALISYRRAIELDPNYVDAHNNIARPFCKTWADWKNRSPATLGHWS